MFEVEMQQYGSKQFCILPLSILQYIIAVLQYDYRFGKRTYHNFKSYSVSINMKIITSTYCKMQIIQGGKVSWFSRMNRQLQNFSVKYFHSDKSFKMVGER